MSNFTPSTNLVMAAYIEGLKESKATKHALMSEFYLWLASVKAKEFRIGYNKATSDIVDEKLSLKGKADAWDEGADAEYAVWSYGAHCQKNPYRGKQA